MKRFAGIIFSFVTVLHGQSILTANYGNERTNANLQERILTPSNVSPDTFGRVGVFKVDGQIYAQPLYAQGIDIGGAARNVVYVATMRNSVYALDADAPTADSARWQVNLGEPVPYQYLRFSDVRPEVGILGTPVIDLSRNAIFVVTDTFETGAAVFRLHALDLSDGHEKLGGPVEIKAVVDGDGDAAEDGRIAFDPSQHIQRPGLLLANGAVYIAFGSHADEWPYHGWIMAYDADNISSQKAIFNSTPHGASGSIWQSGRGLAADQDGNLYVATANGDYDGALNFGQSFLKLSPGLMVLDWFTPQDWNYLSLSDYDLGSLGPVLVPGTNHFLGGDKANNMYLLNRDNMGHLGANNASFPQIFQPVINGGIFNIALWDSEQGMTAYVVGAGEGTKALRISDGKVVTDPVSETGTAADIAYQGMAISADGRDAASGILWMTTGDHGQRTVPGMLRAFDARDLTHELWNSDMNPDRDQPGKFAKFVSPLVANGRVYVPTFSNELVIYGITE